MQTLRPLSLAFSAAFACGLLLAVEATVLEQKVSTRKPKRDGEYKVTEQQQKVLIAPRMVRLEDESGIVNVIRLDRGRHYEIDDLLGSYFERDISNFRARWKKVNALLLKEIAQMPTNHPMRYERIDALTNGSDKWDLIWGLRDGPEKERLLEKYGLPAEKPVYKVEKEEKGKEICGHKCVLYKILEDGRMRAFAWVTPDIRLDRDLIDFLDVTDVLPDEVARELLKVKGFPLEYAVNRRDGRVEHTVTEKVGDRRVDPRKVFDVPGDYEKQERKGAFR